MKTGLASLPRTRHWRVFALAMLALSAYPAFVLIAVYSQWLGSGLPGGRNGPADAYRHSLASAIVAYSLSPRCVDWVTAVMERGGVGTPSRAMDAHNNGIGARIGAAVPCWTAMPREVRSDVDHVRIVAGSTCHVSWSVRQSSAVRRFA
ncbi:hypothetical protein, partial [Xanthomonas perforans]|uniref:hypothetical protein n=1 Tax=Xanthomonas perforans TaxID=442694 RepID=UPI001F47530A